jgi:16S rRNA (guanine527-N7)-methyltransferase
MDFGSGAGLPGIPIQVARPELIVTLAESQNKKAAFLREAIRELGLVQTNVYAGRVEDMPAGQQFDLVTLRAVDKMGLALRAAYLRIKIRGWMAVLTSQRETGTLQSSLPAMEWSEPEAIPGSEQRILMLGRKEA